MKCSQCRADCSDDSTFCGECGARLAGGAGPRGGATASFTRTLDAPRAGLAEGVLLAGRYRILDELGRGGMGKVYLADDVSLARRVAIKVLPDELADDPERLARFEREAKLLASLSHPRIAVVHGLESHEGRRFLVLELVAGEPLVERLRTGPLPVDEAVRVCRQIAEGLESAHAKGIVHRDLKPANVMVMPEGGVKILDFGLAKNCAPGFAESEDDVMTAPGMILGTAVYMSPEQARGKPVDRRTDIWAFGCVLFECLTGQRVFHGESTSETLAAILRSEPDWERLPADTPPETKTLLRRCLRKDPDQRLHDIADARIALEGEPDLPAAAVPVPTSRRVRLTLIAAVGVAALALGWLTRPLLEIDRGAEAVPARASPVVTSISLGPGQRLGGDAFPSWWTGLPTRTELVVGTEGDFVIYSASAEDSVTPEISRIYSRRLDRLEPVPVAGTEGGAMPFLSPDEAWIGFWADGNLKKVPVGGGLPISLCGVPWPFGFSWGADGRIVFAPSRESGLFAVSAEGGEPIRLTRPDPKRGEFSHRLPHVLPGGAHVLFTIARHAWDPRPRIAVLELATGEWRNLLDDGADARFIGTGHVAFLRRGTLMAVPFDPRRLEIIGPPVPLVANVAQALHSTNSRYETGAGQFSISSSGSLVYATGGIEPDRQSSLVWVDEDGAVEPVLPFRAPFFAARLSPDGRRIVYTRLGMEFELWVHDLERGTDTKLAPGGMTEFPQWTPDGTRVVFDWLEAGVPNLYWQSADGSGPVERLTTSANIQWPSSMTPDGRTLAFVEETPATGQDILMLDMRDRTIRPFLDSRHFEGYPEFSPRGQWIAYVTDESGRQEVYVRPFPEGRGRWQISHQGGVVPVWSPDGTRLFYRSGGRGDEVWTVEIHPGAEFSAGRPRRLMRLEGYERGTPIRTWDVSHDGRRFLAAQTGTVAPKQSITELVLVQNWFEDVRRLAPAKR